MLVPIALEAQPSSIPDAMTESLAKQRAALAKQQEAVRTQVVRSSAVAAGSAFFTVPWTRPAAMITADCDALPTARIEELISKVAAKEGVKLDLLREVMHRESAFHPCAVSVKGAQGLMQLMPATAMQFGVKDPFDPEQNTSAGARFLKQLLEKYGGDVSLALAAYNAGPATVDKVGGVPENSETKAYVIEILRRIIL